MAKFIYIYKKSEHADEDTSAVRLVNVDQIEDVSLNDDYEIVIAFASGRRMTTAEKWDELEAKLGGATHNSDVCRQAPVDTQLT